MASCTVCTTRAAPAPAELPCAIVRIVFAGSGTVSTEGYQRRVRRVGSVDLRVDIERRLVIPELEHDQLVGIQGALKDLELLTARFLLHGTAALGHSLSKLGTLPGLAYVVMTRRTGIVSPLRVARNRDDGAWRVLGSRTAIGYCATVGRPMSAESRRAGDR
jgi:hypothetical protein